MRASRPWCQVQLVRVKVKQIAVGAAVALPLSSLQIPLRRLAKNICLVPSHLTLTQNRLII
jgi:hypothetical protein